jgi:AraC-like DNA-binding protein
MPGDILLIGPMELHQMQVQKDGAPYERIVLWLGKPFLEQLSTPQTSLTRCFDISAPGHDNLLRVSPSQRVQIQMLMEQLDTENRSPADTYGKDLAASGCLLQLLVQLNRLAAARPTAAGHTETGIVPGVLRYINEHYNEELSLDMLANKFFVSKYHLSHEFARRVGTSVYRYIIQKRLVIAKQMLAGGVAPTDVYKHCGFGDYANFYRAFKSEYHISPKQFMSGHTP